MGKCDSAYGVATPLLWENVIQLMVWLFHFSPTPSQLTTCECNSIFQNVSKALYHVQVTSHHILVNVSEFVDCKIMLSHFLNFHVMICVCTSNVHGLWYTHVNTAPTRHSDTM